MLRLAVAMVAVAAGGGAGWLALQATWREPAEPVTVVVEEQKVDVLTPTVDLMRGAKVSAEHLTWTPWPATQINPGMILRDEKPDARGELSGRVLRSNLYTGEPVRMQHLAKGEGSFLSMVLQPGMRAIGVQISEDKTAGGFVLPNDRVDVMHTVVRDFDGNGTATGATRTILTNVRVLAIGQTTFEGQTLVMDDAAAAPARTEGGNGSTLTGKTATLEVSAEQGEILLAAVASGQLALALRAADDFGLSGIGDLAMLEGVAPLTGTASAAEPPHLAEITNAAPGQREVMIISAGLPQIVLTKVREVK